jgi:RHS repeat-associated protein
MIRIHKYDVQCGQSFPDIICFLPKQHKFTGKERDSESGLDAFGFRYYSSQYGRFMSVDPAMESEILELPQTWNRYSYVYNRPTFGTDPDGRCPPCVGAIVGGIIGGAIEGSINLGSQLYANGGNLQNVNWTSVGAATVGGAVAGGLAGATGGVSLLGSEVVGEAAVGALTTTIGNTTERTINGEQTTAVDVETDLVTGYVGGTGGHVAEDFIHVPEEPFGHRAGRKAARAYAAQLARRSNALIRPMILSNIAGSAESHLTDYTLNDLTDEFDWLQLEFQQQNQQQQQQQEQVTHCFLDEYGNCVQ